MVVASRSCVSVCIIVYRSSQKRVSTRNEVDISSHIALWRAGITAFVSYHFSERALLGPLQLVGRPCLYSSACVFVIKRSDGTHAFLLCLGSSSILSRLLVGEVLHHLHDGFFPYPVYFLHILLLSAH